MMAPAASVAAIAPAVGVPELLWGVEVVGWGDGDCWV